VEAGKNAVKQAVFELNGKFDRISCRVDRNEWRIETSARYAKSFRLKRIEIAEKTAFTPMASSMRSTAETSIAVFVSRLSRCCATVEHAMRVQ
jgi:hypothetical protein